MSVSVMNHSGQAASRSTRLGFGHVWHRWLGRRGVSVMHDVMQSRNPRILLVPKLPPPKLCTTCSLEDGKWITSVLLFQIMCSFSRHSIV
jgi:hypothetical protein